LFQTKSQLKTLEKYQTQQQEYQQLFSEYDKIKSDDPSNPLLEKKIKDLTKKQVQLNQTFTKLS